MHWHRLVVLVAYGNEVLAQRTTIDAIKNHSAFERCDSFNFRGYSLEEWFEELLRLGCDQLLLIDANELRSYIRREVSIEKEIQSLVLEDYDLVRLRYSDRLEDWRIEYVSWVKDNLYALPVTTEPSFKLKHLPFESLTICAEALEITITECLRYESIERWVECFHTALETLRNGVVTNDTLPVNGYSQLARKVFKAASRIRGITVGNSSWSDYYSDTVPDGFVDNVYKIARGSEIMAVNSYDRTLEVISKPA